MLAEHYRDVKLKELYYMLTRSDFNGDLKDEYVICLLYAMRCIDRCQGDEALIREKDYVNLAKEIIRIYESADEGDMDHVSIMTWTRGLFSYMRDSGRSYQDVHKMSCYDLLDHVIPYIS